MKAPLPTRRTSTATALLLSLSLLVGACAPAAEGEAFERFDAPYAGPPETVALLIDTRARIASATQETMADAALFALLDHPYAYRRFDVIERSRVDTILAEYDLARGGLVDPSTAARVGQLLGAQSIVLMSLSAVSVTP
jgi:curli biogenesis system outer membrane secretion channel CsgG